MVVQKLLGSQTVTDDGGGGAGGEAVGVREGNGVVQPGGMAVLPLVGGLPTSAWTPAGGHIFVKRKPSGNEQE